MRSLVVAMALAAVACTSFGSGTGEPEPSPSPTGTTSTADGGPPAPGTDGGQPSEGGVAPKSLKCGMNECDPGGTCCVQANAATCNAPDCNGGWRFQCFSAADCPLGKVCCNRDRFVTCEATCEGGGAEQICDDGAECPNGMSCQTGACGSNEQYGVCEPVAALKPLCF